MARVGWLFGVILLISSCLVPGPVQAQPAPVCHDYVQSSHVEGIDFDASNLSLVGHLSHTVRAVAEQDGYLYAGMNRELAVIDASDPGRLVRTGAVRMPEMIQDVAVAGDYAYVVLYDHELRIVDVSDPQAPVMAGACDLQGGAAFTHVAVVGHIVYAVGFRGALYVIDVAKPSAPTVVAHLESPPWHEQASALVISGSHLYIADRQSGLRVISVADPASPQPIAAYHASGDDMWDLALQDNLLYVANGIKGLRVLDVATPAAPREIGRYWPLGVVDRISVAGDLALVRRQTAPEWYRVDVSDPAQPHELGQVEALQGAWDILVVGQRVYAIVYGNDSGLKTIDISVPDAPQVVAHYGTSFSISQAAYAQGYLFTSSPGSPALSVFDVDDPTSPRWLIDYPLTAQTFTVVEDILYAAGAGLSLIDVSDVLAPVQIGYYFPEDDPNGGWFEDIVVELPYAYIAARGHLYIIDVSDPANPRQVAHLMATQPVSSHLALMGDRLIMTSESAVHVIDIATITEPVVVAVFMGTGSAGDVVAAGDHAYVAWKHRDQPPWQGIEVIDLAPIYPVHLGFVETLIDINAMVLDAPFLYMTWGRGEYGGVAVLDIAHPTLPVEVAHYNLLQGWAGQLAVDGDTLYVPDHDLLVLAQDRTVRGHWWHLPTLKTETR